MEKKQTLFLTFFDVHKAYDQADVNNMLHIAWNCGVRGKIWRLLKNMSTNLVASVKTRFGLTRLIQRENGGRQGSRLTGKLFAKQMDTLSEKFISGEIDGAVTISEDLSIGCLEWVDDVLTMTQSIEKAQKILNEVDDFAKANKIQWGLDKCKMMQIGKKANAPEEWKLGDKFIGNTTSYKYLGDVVTSDGKNSKNILSRENKVYALVRKINTTASSDIMRGIETSVILDLYHVYIIPCLLNNAESWMLSKKEEDQLDIIGIRAVKRLFSLPYTSPNASIIYSFGLLYISQVVDQIQFKYLYRLLTRDPAHWTHKTLMRHQDQNVAWAKHISSKLTEYELETDWNAIKRKRPNEWKEIVKRAVLKRNGQKIMDNCVSVNEQGTKILTKTKHIHDKLNNNIYNAKPIAHLVSGNKQRARTIFLAQNHMLECGRNMKGTMSENCTTCNVIDDEQHRLAACEKRPNLETNDETQFEDIYSENIDKLNNILNEIEKTWDTRYTNGRMKK